MAGIAITSWIGPMIEHLDLDLVARELTGLPGWARPGSGTVRITPANIIAQRVEHEGTAIAQLQSKPVPAAIQRPTTPFAIHPGQPVHVQRFSIAQQLAVHGNARN